MSRDGGTTLATDDAATGAPARAPRREVRVGGACALIVAWAAEPGHVGELLALPDRDDDDDDGGGADDARGDSGGTGAGRGPSRRWVFGRGERRADDPHPRAVLVRQRPGADEACAPLADRFVSRCQLALARAEDGDALLIENTGGRALRVDDAPCPRARVEPGALVEIERRVLFVCAPRPPRLAPLATEAYAPLPPFGAPDAQGLVGESPALWALREQIAQAAEWRTPVLLWGPRGAGRTLAARAVHALSARGARPFAACDEPAVLTTRGEARAALLARAAGGTVYLPAFGRAGGDAQAAVLRAFDSDPEVRRADVRLMVALDGPPAALELELAARFPLRCAVPGLSARREDIPLLARHLLRRAGRADARGEVPQLGLARTAALLRCRYTDHVRELEALLASAPTELP